MRMPPMPTALRPARMATTTTPRTRALHTDTTDRSGLAAASLSEPAHGFAADTLLADTPTVADTTDADMDPAHRFADGAVNAAADS